ncbi:hypothetical protein LZ683_08580 [Comamonas testosteroni]|uniref:hypothetical protein n=1 Tax=Comamonas testosteroni TaxID=285 RepID=UPI0023AADE45|nr:hypothetical protein [Comamonas testosteroni]WEE79396.1 hypothetical protein LZ683_08580 [Comamonas testosteroni]
MNVQIPVKWLQELLALCGPEDHELRERVMVSITAMDEQAAAPVVLPEPFTTLVRKNSWSPSCYEASPRSNSQEYGRQWADERINVHTEQQVRALLAGISAPAAVAVAVPDGWREKFAADVYADLAAADNQDVPLEEYPARILKVLDSIVGPRHPVVIKWRNDAIRNCIAIAYKYCRDPESHKYLKQDLEAMLTTEPAPQAQADARDDSALLDAMERQRIAVVPEYEGPWDAEVYNGDEKPNHRGSGSTPREAIRAAIAASKE